MAAVADRDQAVTGLGNGQQEGFRREGRGFGGFGGEGGRIHQ
jgi:hypothetical protein